MFCSLQTQLIFYIGLMTLLKGFISSSLFVDSFRFTIKKLSMNKGMLTSSFPVVMGFLFLLIFLSAMLSGKRKQVCLLLSWVRKHFIMKCYINLVLYMLFYQTEAILSFFSDWLVIFLQWWLNKYWRNYITSSFSFLTYERLIFKL